MSTSKVTGVIDGISDYKQKDFFNIALGDSEQDDNWYIGDGTLRDYGQFDKGDKVRITVDDNKGSVTNVEPVGKPQENDVISEDGGAGSESASTSAPNGSEGGQSSSAYISADETSAVIRAAETVRDLHPELKEGEHIQKVSEYAEGYHNKMKDLGDE